MMIFWHLEVIKLLGLICLRIGKCQTKAFLSNSNWNVTMEEESEVTHKNVLLSEAVFGLEENEQILENTCSFKLQGRYVCPTPQALDNLLPKLHRSAPVSELTIQSVGGRLELPSEVARSLRVLRLTSSATTSLAPDQVFENLEVLTLSHNPGFDPWSLLDVSGLDNLLTLELTGVALSSPSNLTQLLGRLPKLQTLEIASCGLEFLEDCTFCQLKNLQVLNLSSNAMHELDLRLSLLRTLKQLDASRCQLENINVQKDDVDVTRTQKTLNMLDVSHNNLAYVHPSLIQAIVPSDAHIDVTGNPLNVRACSQYPLYQRYKVGHTVVGGGALARFSLRRVTLCTWHDCPENCMCDNNGLRSVVCIDQDLHSVPAIGPSGTEVLVLDHNSIANLTQLYSSVWPNLRAIFVDDNRLTSLSAEQFNLTTLTTLSVSGNQLGSIHEADCALLSAVEHLNVSNNQLVSLDASSCGYLQVVELDASWNYIKDIRDLALTSLPYLKFLNLSYNSINFLARSVLDDLPFLEVLDLSYNHLKDVDEKAVLRHAPARHRALQRVLMIGNDLDTVGPLADLLQSKNNVSVNVKGNPLRCPPMQGILTLDNNSECDEEHTSVNLHRSIFGMLATLTVLVMLAVFVAFNYLSKLRTLRHVELPCPAPKKYHLYPLHDCHDDKFVCDELMPQLQKQLPGIQLLKCSDMNLYGRPFLESFREYVRECSAVLVVVSAASCWQDNYWTRLKLRVCIQQHFRDSGLLVMGLLMLDSPPLSELRSDPIFNFIVEDRKFVHCGEGDYMSEIKKFVGPVRARKHAPAAAEDDRTSAMMY